MREQYDDLANEVIKHIGGEENVKNATHCATRLRFQLFDEKKLNEDALSETDGVIRIIKSGGQIQVVIGSHVSDVYDPIAKKISKKNQEALIDSEQKDTSNEKDNRSFFNKALSLISAIFSPYIGVLAGAGILKGITLFLLMMEFVSEENIIFMTLNSISSGIFTFLPVFIAVTAAERFGINKFISLGITTAMIFPLTDINMPDSGMLIGFEIDFKNYAGAVIPAILVIISQIYVERYVKRVIPNVAHTVLVPFLTLLVVGVIAFWIVGPLGTLLSQGVGAAYFGLYNLSPVIAGTLLAGLIQVLVIFGIHWGVLPIALINIQNVGFDTILPLASMSVFGQFGAILGMYFVVKTKKEKTLVGSSTLSAFFGITEPAIYGTNLKYKYPFIIGLIASAIGGGISSWFVVRAFAFTPIYNVFSFPIFIGEGSNFLMFVISTVIVFLVALFGTIIWGVNGSIKM